MHHKINKVLVANRGEIALRVMRTLKVMGIQSVAVYSEIDRDAPHVLFADEAILLGPSPSSESYLRGDLIISEALKLSVDAIHPGYGFLSENALFAKAIFDAGMIFIGPSIEAINTMGSKLDAKEAVAKYDIPMVPGTDKPLTNIKEGVEISNKIGFPILIKASAGGGGKGMRVVENPEEFEEQLVRAQSEALSSFGNGDVFIEKYITSPRHIEIQILADNYGNVIHLNERECSIQRRHQKVIEEAPAVVMTEELRVKMGEAAINVAKSCNYQGAGTVEFLLDDQSDFYFLEMNTRLQVEHSVTEAITGLDLVEEQILVAQGVPLRYQQKDIQINGHAIELRIYAENTKEGFLPDTGTLNTYILPSGEGVRIDDGYCEGMEIPIYYDPMIAKLTVHANNRTLAIKKLLKAIKDFKIEGIETTLDFGRFTISHEVFINGNIDTHFVKNYYEKEKHNIKDKNLASKIALSIYLDHIEQSKEIKSANGSWYHNRTI